MTGGHDPTLDETLATPAAPSEPPAAPQHGVAAEPVVARSDAEPVAVEESPREPRDAEPELTPAPPRAVYRHALPTRLAHWIVVICLPVMTMSGLQIFNAHPALYWGDRSDRDRPVLALRSVVTPDGGVRGVTQILGVQIDTTGVLGASRGATGELADRGFPRWATLPGEQWLAMGRRWHFFFAWILALTGLGFGLYALASRHLARDLAPWPRDLRSLGASIRAHLRFRHPTGDGAARYSVLQKIAYTGVIFGLGPLIVVTGLAMSPRMDATLPWVVRALGGRQSARTVHFLATFAFLGFLAGHLFMVAVTGVVNNVRSMLTGWYRVFPEPGEVRHGHVD